MPGSTWQLLHSDLAASFRGFATVGKALDPEKVRHYRNELAATGADPARGSGGLRPRHGRPRLPPALHPAGDAVGADLAVLHGPGDVASGTGCRPRRPLRPPRSTWAAPAKPRWCCNSSRGRRRSSRSRSSMGGTTGPRRPPLAHHRSVRSPSLQRDQRHRRVLAAARGAAALIMRHAPTSGSARATTAGAARGSRSEEVRRAHGTPPRPAERRDPLRQCRRG